MNTNFVINTSKIRGYKNAFFAVSLILIFAIEIGMAFAPTASAQVGIAQPRKTIGYIAVSPIIIGVGQNATVNLWVYPPPQDYAEGVWYQGFTGITVTFIKPDGTTDTLTPTDDTGVYNPGYTESSGSLVFYYTPNEVGNWSVTLSFPAQNLTDQTGTVQYAACTSAPAYFAVATAAQNAGILNGYPWVPLPNANTYWTYPINANNREWSAISGNWLQWGENTIAGKVSNSGTGGEWQMYGTAPSTGHIVWDTQIQYGGLVGGNYGSIGYFTASAGPVIIDGKVFLNVGSNFECIDLTTGKIDYTAPGTISDAVEIPGNAFAQAVSGVGNPSGADVNLQASTGKTPTPELLGMSGSTWTYYNVLTGGIVRTITNASGTNFNFIDGTPLAYGSTFSGMNATTYITSTDYVWEWNYSKVSTSTNDWWTGIVWYTNINPPGASKKIGSAIGPGDGSGKSTFCVSADLTTVEFGGGGGCSWYEGFSTATGKSVWNDTLPYTSEINSGWSQVYNTNDFMAFDEATSTWYCYSIDTGALLWSTVVGTYPWNTKTGLGMVNDNNNLYIGTASGQIVALSIATGNMVWQTTPIPTTEFVENVIPSFSNIVTGGGLLYTFLGESNSYTLNPVPRYGIMICVNVTTGQTVYTLNGGLTPTALANGYLTAEGTYDGLEYCIGKGQTSTAVSVQNDVISEGSTALIKGNVLDQSPAQPGTPAVSDSNINEWMDYLHMQNATLLNNPPKEQGVTVTLTAIDPNNNTVTIGTTTTDSAGNYYYNYVPSTTGIYKITANFAGSNSYWPSTSETGLTVTPAPTTTSGTSATNTSSGITETTLYTAVAVIVVVIIIAVAAAVLVLRKRP